MTFNEYQKLAISTDLWAGRREGILSPIFLEKAFGLVGEAGEVAEKLKKLYRDHDSDLTPELKADLVKEIGDILWYVSAVLYYLEVDFDDVATANIEKILSRKERGKTKGSGDNR